MRRLHQFLPLPARRGLKRVYEALKARERCRGAESGLLKAAGELSQRSLRTVDDLEGWVEQRPHLRAKFAWMLGLEPVRKREALKVEVGGEIVRQSYKIERLLFESIPGLLVTANLYLPLYQDGPVPVVLYLNGHWPSLWGAKVGYQDRYLWYPQNGFACLVIDPLEFGEIPGIHQGTRSLNRWDWLSRGYTPAGVEVWNAMRGIDWLEARPEVDAKRIGVTGISGGGVIAQYLSALDERVRATVASCSTFTIGNQATRGLIDEQCDCTFYPNVFGIDFPVVDALIAPRPLLLLGGRRDPIFPPEGFREAYSRAKAIYDLYEKERGGWPRICLVESADGHADPPVFLRECHRWMWRWVRGGEPSAFDDRDEVRLECEHPDVLACTVTPRAGALNYGVDKVWVRAKEMRVPGSLEEWGERRKAVLGVLRERVFPWMPTKSAPYRVRRLRSSGAYAGELSSFGEYELESEPGLRIRVRTMAPRERAGKEPVLVWVKDERDHVRFPDLDEVLPVLPFTYVVVVSPRFTDRRLSAGEFARIERTAAVTGRTISGLQVWDVIRATRWALDDSEVDHGDVALYGGGGMGVVCLYAALFEARVDHVLVRAPPTSHARGPAMLTILRDTDIPETAAMLAPRRLTVIDSGGEGLELTKSVYQMLGAGDRFSAADSLAEGLLRMKDVEAPRDVCRDAAGDGRESAGGRSGTYKGRNDGI